jgi:cyclohexyl-isocyanide hydratase
MRWLYHLTTTDSPKAGPEGFLHCSFAGDLAESRRLHFANVSDADLRLIRVDPRRALDVRVEGPRMMPHVYGDIARDAWSFVEMNRATDLVTGTKFAVVGFARMTLLDLVGVLDPLGRIVTMDVDRDASIEVVSATEEPWSGFGADFSAKRVRPPLEDFDVLVVAGGPETRALENDPKVVDWLRAFPESRMAASVCTGALLLGAAGRLRGKRATTHHASLDLLAKHGATAVPRTRVVRDGQLMTAGGVTSAMDLGLAIVEWLYGDEARARIAARMEYPAAP